LNLLLDTNVFLDWLLKRNENQENAEKLVSYCISGKVNGFVTSHSLADFFYIIRKHFSTEDRRQLLLFLVSGFSIIIEDKSMFLTALNSENFFDLEDGLQMACAEKAHLDYIVTQNLKDFISSPVTAISIAECLTRI
jgi:predicted nucleic acid-binding protein